MIDIKTSYKDGAIWHTPYKKAWFWWVKLDFSSTDLKEVGEYLKKEGYEKDYFIWCRGLI